MREQEIARVFTDFTGHFIRHYSKSDTLKASFKCCFQIASLALDSAPAHVAITKAHFISLNHNR